MIFETARNDGEAASGPGTGVLDVLRTAFEKPIYASNPAAESNALERAYDDRIDAIVKTTGQQLENPMRMLAPRREAEPGESGLFPRLARRPIDAGRDLHAEFDAQLAKLAEQFPDHRHAIKPERSVREDAREIARKAEYAAADVYERYDGPPLLGGLASLAGGFAGGMNDPTTLMTLPVGPSASVARGLSPMLWMALKQGAANAGVEALFQPQVARWRRDAGIGYDLGDFAENVGSAFVLAGAMDFASRGAIRAVQGWRGRVPKLDSQGGIDGWQTPEQAAAAAELARKVDLVGRASQGDVEAIRTLGNDAGVGTTPELRSVLRQMEDEAATTPRGHGLDPDESDAAFMQALRHVADDEMEPPPGRVDPLPQRAANDAVDPEFQRVLDGTGTVLDAAIVLRQRPDLTGATSLASDHMQVARALARLSDEAFAAVLEGRIEPAMAALVGRHVDDPLRQASMIEALAAARPESLESGRKFIADMREPASLGRGETYLGGLDDPHGAQAKAHTEALQAALSDRIARAEQRLAGGGEPDPLDVELRNGLAEADALDRMAEVIEFCKAA